jgi:hypothetical protein
MGNEDKNSNGWNEWSKHVLKELERLNSNYENLGTKIDSIKGDVHEEMSALRTNITKINSMQAANESSLEDVKAWKSRMEYNGVLKSSQELLIWKTSFDEIASPSQIKECIQKVESQEKFKTQAITVFLVVQAMVGVAIALIKFYG